MPWARRPSKRPRGLYSLRSPSQLRRLGPAGDDPARDRQPAFDRDDEEDHHHIVRNLETDFGLEQRTRFEQRWIRAAQVIPRMQDHETAEQQTQRMIAHLRHLIEVVEDRH